MEYRTLGHTGITVSRLCFGTLTLGPLQVGLSLAAGVALLQKAVAHGVTFFDTAQSYSTYPFLRELIAREGRSCLVIATKSYAVNTVEAEEALREALCALNTDYVDIMLLHEQLSAATLRGHEEALRFYLHAKKQGYLRAVGLSSHHIAAIRAGVLHPDIDVIHPLYNRDGFGIQDGTAAQMRQAISENTLMGKGVYAMKSLGGGHLLRDARACLEHVLNFDDLHSIAVGMQNEDELTVNVAYFGGREPEESQLARLVTRPRRLHIEDYCQTCGRCLLHCPTGALRLVASGLTVDRERCLTCGYCAKACPEFALKVL